MKRHLKDNPREWRKAALLAALGLAAFSSLLRWRHVLPHRIWLTVLTLSALLAICAALKPRWFRGYYLLSMRLGFAISQFGGRVALGLFFFLVITTLGWILRLTGQDPLQLKRPRERESCWRVAKDSTPLDRLF